MSKRVKITMYLDAESEFVDLDHPSGLTEEGFERLVGISSEPPLCTDQFEDHESEVEDDDEDEKDDVFRRPKTREK